MTDRFDDHVDSYHDEVSSSVSFTGKDVDYFARRKVDELISIVERRIGDPSRLAALDVGCGIGVTDSHLAHRFASLHGLDTSADAIEAARATNPTVVYDAYDGERLPFDDSTFDLAFAICVFHHVDPAERAGFVADVARVVRPGGLVAIFEHNPLNPLTRVAVSRCEFDEGVELLPRSESAMLLSGAGLKVEEKRYILFLPIDSSWAHRVDRALSRVPLGGQHYVVGRRAP